MCGPKQAMVLQIWFESGYFLHLKFSFFKKKHICKVVRHVWKSNIRKESNGGTPDTGFVWNVDILSDFPLYEEPFQHQCQKSKKKREHNNIPMFCEIDFKTSQFLSTSRRGLILSMQRCGADEACFRSSDHLSPHNPTVHDWSGWRTVTACWMLHVC